MADGMLRSPTFLVGAERQRKNLDEFQRREQQLAEAYHKNKPLCFNASSFQKTHPVKAQKGHNDADACLTAPLVLGVADGVSQIEEFGIDASLLPNELLKVVQQLGMHQLIPGAKLPTADTYRGPVSMLRRAFQATEHLGSLTVVLAVMDNSTRIHGKLHPMIAIITVGDCELVVLRRVHGSRSPLELVCHTEMQRIDGHAQTPLQLARVDDRIDPDFSEELTLEVIERGSAVHCVSAYEGDIVIMGSDGVFDNLYLDEIMEPANNMLPPHAGTYPAAALHALSQRIVELCHAKTRPMPNGLLPDAPIGRGGKKDDTSCVVAEVIEWTKDLQKLWTPKPMPSTWPSWLRSLGLGPPHGVGSILSLDSCCVASYESDNELDWPEDLPRRRGKATPAAAFQPEDAGSAASAARGLNGFRPTDPMPAAAARGGSGGSVPRYNGVAPQAAPQAAPRVPQAPQAPQAFGMPHSSAAPWMAPMAAPGHPCQMYPMTGSLPHGFPGSFVPASWPGAPGAPGAAVPYAMAPPTAGALGAPGAGATFH